MKTVRFGAYDVAFSTEASVEKVLCHDLETLGLEYFEEECRDWLPSDEMPSLTVHGLLYRFHAWFYQLADRAMELESDEANPLTSFVAVLHKDGVPMHSWYDIAHPDKYNGYAMLFYTASSRDDVIKEVQACQLVRTVVPFSVTVTRKETKAA